MAVMRVPGLSSLPAWLLGSRTNEWTEKKGQNGGGDYGVGMVQGINWLIESIEDESAACCSAIWQPLWCNNMRMEKSFPKNILRLSAISQQPHWPMRGIKWCRRSTFGVVRGAFICAKCPGHCWGSKAAAARCAKPCLPWAVQFGKDQNTMPSNYSERYSECQLITMQWLGQP